jgi:LacI family transcriptional regulator
VKRFTSIVTDRAPKRKRPTLRQLADLTGLSPAGAHYALRGERVSAETSARVRAEADRIGFRSDPIARALRGGASGVVGVIGGSLADYWHQEFASELQQHLRRDRRLMLLSDAAGDAASEIELALRLVDQRVDGLIVLPVVPGSADWRQVVTAVPTVAVGAALPDPAGAVSFATQAGIRMVLDHLRNAGHRRILMLSPGVHRVPRLAGVHRVDCGFAPAEGGRAATEALSSARPPSAVFALTDALAYGTLAACAELGLDVPGDVAVAGFDDHPLSALIAPALTTVSWNTAQAAAAAAAMLGQMVAGAAGGRLVLPPQLVVRASTDG